MNLLKAGLASISSLMLLAAPAFAQDNTLTAEEKAAGWQLLFNGTNFDGWHKFHAATIGPGWTVEDGAMSKKEGGGDIETANEYDWFELQLDYKISKGGNSGIMYHVSDKGRTIWWTGPEFQLEDDYPPEDTGSLCGWLYGLYQPPIDPATGKPLDTTKPAEQWNHVRLIVGPTKCEHFMNGTKYLEYDLHSADFKARVAKSKFHNFNGFAESDIGHIGLQGDHPGTVSFKNVKLRPIKQ